MANELKYIDELVRKKMTGHAVESTVDNFAAIQRAAFWRNFFTFRFLSLNAYYAGAVVLLGIFSLGYFSASDQMAGMEETNYEIAQNINTQPENNTEQTHITKTEITSATPEENIETEIEFTRPDKAPDFTATNKIENISATEKNIETKPEKTLLISSEDKHNRKISSNEISQETENSKPELEISVSDDFENKENSNDNTIDPKNLSEEINDTKILSEDKAITNNYKIGNSGTGLLFSDIIAIKNSPMFFIDPVPLGHSVPKTLTPSLRSYSDSIDYYLPPAMRSRWMLGAYYAPVYSAARNSFQNQEFQNLINEKNKIEEPGLMFSTGVSVQYQGRKKLGFQTGLSYSQLGDLFSRGEITDIKNSSYPLYPEGGFFNIDTIEFFNIDSLLQGIEYIETIYDSTWIDDNTLINVSDTSKYSGARSHNKFTYIEVPLMFTYRVSGGKFDYRFKLGVAAGFLIEAEGKKLNTENPYEIVDFDYDTPEYRKVNYSVIGGVDVYYRFHKRFSFSTGILYRRQLLDIYKNYPYNLKYTSTQINFGLHYHL